MQVSKKLLTFRIFYYCCIIFSIGCAPKNPNKLSDIKTDNQENTNSKYIYNPDQPLTKERASRTQELYKNRLRELLKVTEFPFIKPNSNFSRGDNLTKMIETVDSINLDILNFELGQKSKVQEIVMRYQKILQESLNGSFKDPIKLHQKLLNTDFMEINNLTLVDEIFDDFRDSIVRMSDIQIVGMLDFLLTHYYNKYLDYPPGAKNIKELTYLSTEYMLDDFIEKYRTHLKEKSGLPTSVFVEMYGNTVGYESEKMLKGPKPELPQSPQKDQNPLYRAHSTSSLEKSLNRYLWVKKGKENKPQEFEEILKEIEGDPSKKKDEEEIKQLMESELQRIQESEIKNSKAYNRKLNGLKYKQILGYPIVVLTARTYLRLLHEHQ